MALLSYCALPQTYQKKVDRKLMLPYKYIYTLDMAQVIEPHRTQMKKFYNNHTQHSPKCYIAHGGGVGAFHYKNCLEGVEEALSKGLCFIEIDLLKTVDGHIIGGHGWDDFARFTGKNTHEVANMPYEELKKLKIDGKYTVITAELLCELLEKYPEMILVTDHFTDFELLLSEIPYNDRMIVETIGGLYDYKRAIQLGVKYPIYSAFDIDTIEKYEFPLVILDAKFLNDKASAERIRALHNKGLTILVWNGKYCDCPDFIAEHLGHSVSMIYTDTWYPTGKSPIVAPPDKQ